MIWKLLLCFYFALLEILGTFSKCVWRIHPKLMCETNKGRLTYGY